MALDELAFPANDIENVEAEACQNPETNLCGRKIEGFRACHTGWLQWQSEMVVTP